MLVVLSIYSRQCRRMMYLCVVMSCMLISGSAWSSSIELAHDGKPSAAIVLAKDAILPEITAAEELKMYLDQMVGGSFSIVNEADAHDNKSSIHVGMTSLAHSRGLSCAGPEQWTIDAADNVLVLAGGRPRGTLYAVWHFLETQGVRWWTLWEQHVPRRPSLRVDTGRSSGQPAFDFRHVHIIVHDREDIWQDNDGRVAARWRLNRWGGRDIDVKYGYDAGYAAFPLPWLAHTLTYSLVSPSLYESHPDWFALQGGRRVTNALCLSNQALLEYLEQRVRELITQEIRHSQEQHRPGKLIYNLSNSDVHITRCQCPRCNELAGGTQGNSQVTLLALNSLAGKLADDYPEVRLETLAYNDTEPVPTVRAASNVQVTLADTVSSRAVPAGHLLQRGWVSKVRGWSKIAGHLRLWLYGWSYEYLGEPPVPSEFAIPDNYQLYHASGVEGIMVQHDGCHSWQNDMWDMKVYLAARFMENPRADINAEMEDWVGGYFGPGAPYVLSYRRMLHKASMASPANMTPLCKTDYAGYPYLDAELIADALGLLEQARQACDDNEDYLRRLRDVRRTLDQTTVLAYPLLMRRWLASGREWKDFPLDRGIAADRWQAAVHEHATFRFGDPGYTQRLMDIIRPRIELSLSLKDQWNCPDILDGKPVKVLLELVPTMGGSYGVTETIEKDHTSDTGVTQRVDTLMDGDNVLTGGIWHIPEYDHISVTAMKTVRHEDIPGDGYHWYRLFDDVSIAPGDRLYLTREWSIQYQIDAVHRPAMPHFRFDIWAHIRFDDTLPETHDTSRRTRAYVDRVLITTSRRGR